MSELDSKPKRKEEKVDRKVKDEKERRRNEKDEL